MSPAIDIGLIMQPNELLNVAITQLGLFVYVILFAIIFAETGLVVAPFLPGDSLLFAAGALAGLNKLEWWPLLLTLTIAAVAGDACNYWIGRTAGKGLLHNEKRTLVKPENIEKTEAFFLKHGGKTIVIARFVPIVRTFAPFVAGMCHMPLPRFWAFNITGAVAWVLLFTGAGYIFGNIPWIEQNLGIGVLVIVFISVAPMVFEAWRRRREAKREAAAAAEPEPTEL